MLSITTIRLLADLKSLGKTRCLCLLEEVTDSKVNLNEYGIQDQLNMLEDWNSLDLIPTIKRLLWEEV